MDLDRWHDLLTNRYVCEACTTRFYTPYTLCPACGQVGTIHLLHSFLRDWARSDDEYRRLIQMGQDPQRMSDGGPLDVDYAGAGSEYRL